MKLFRKNKKGLQVLKLRMAAPDKAEFTLFPMIHIADRAFFKHVKANASRHDAVFMEGVRSFVGRTADKAHRIATVGSRKLAAQGRVFRKNNASPEGEGGRLFNADIEPDEFRKHWSKISLGRRILFHVILLLLGLAMRFRFVRNFMTESFANDAQSNLEDMDKVFGKGFQKAIINTRDAALLKNCETIMQSRDYAKVAVVWGAGHMPSLIQSLTKKHGYKIVNREWITAISA